MNKLKLLLIYVLIIGIVGTTYCAFTLSVEKTSSIQTKELSAKFLDNAELLIKVQNLDSSITSIDKNNDLNRILTLPTVTLTEDNLVSTNDSSMPIYLWIDNNTIYYYTGATNIDLNNI